VALAALDAACQLAGRLLVHRTSASLRDLTRVATALILSALMVAAYRWLVRALEGRSADELGLEGAGRGLAVGTAAGLSLFGFIYLALWSLGAVTFQGYAGLSGIGRALMMAIASAVGEEILFRGYAFERLGKLLGTSVAAKAFIVVVTAAWFGWAHYLSQGLSGVELAATVGAVWAAIFATTGRIFLLMAAHTAFDLTAYAMIYWNLETHVAHLIFK